MRKLRRCRRRSGLTMVELLGVLVVIAILLAIAGWSISANIKRSNREAVVNELQVYATSIADAYYDMGAPSISPSDPAGLSEFKRYLAMVQSDYLSVTFDTDSIVATDTGFECDITAPLDVYESQYHCWFVTDDAVMKYVMIASGGDDGRIDASGYGSQNYGDDIVLIVRPKV